MATDAFQIEVTRVALGTAAKHGFVLGGGQALVALGIVDRPTEDIDLFSPTEHTVPEAATAVRAALEQAGFDVHQPATDVELSDLFDGFELEYIEWEVRRGDDYTELTLAHLPHHRAPVILDIGPVMNLDDLLGSKVAAAAGRAQSRDFIDIAAATSRYPLADLIALGRDYDPGLTDEDFTGAGQQLDRMTDARFAPYGLDADQIAQVRAKLAEWPRPGR